VHLKGVAERQDNARAFLHGQCVDDHQFAAHVLQVMRGAQEVAVPFCRIWRARYEGRLLKNVSRTDKIGLNRAIDYVEPAEAVDRPQPRIIGQMGLEGLSGSAYCTNI